MALVPCPECQTPVSTRAAACPACGCQIHVPAPLPELRLASPWIRFQGFLGDVLIPIAVIGGVALFLDSHVSKGNHDVVVIGWLILSILIWMLAQIILMAGSKSIGKALLHTRVVTPDGKPAGFARIFFMRGLLPGVLFAIPILGWIPAIVDVFMVFSQSRQRLVDRIAGTQVVMDR